MSRQLLGVHMFRYVATIVVAILLSAPLKAGVTPFPASFHTQMVPTNGTSLFVRVGGEGPAVVLLHGFGFTGDMWAPLAIVLAKDHTVIVPDLRGMGMSDHPDTGYTKKNQAVDIAGVMDALKIQKADLVTHDIGNMVGYALAAQYPVRVTRWVVIDAPLPGIGDWDNIIRSPTLWHFDFRGPDEERLVQGRERIYLDRFWNELSGDPKGSMKIRGGTLLPGTHGRMRCTMPSSSLVQSVKTSSPATSRAASCPTPGTGSWRSTGHYQVGYRFPRQVGLGFKQSETFCNHELGHLSSQRTAKEADMASKQKTVIVTGASQGIGAGAVQSFLDRGYNVVANSRNIRKSDTFTESDHLTLVDGSIGESAVASKIVETAVRKFGSIDALVNNAGIFFTKPFCDYTAEDFKALSSTNLEGFLYVTQGAVKQMLAQKSGGSVVTITAALAANPIAGITASVPMITKGGLEAVTLSLASEYAKEKIRFNAVAPGVVDTPLHKDNPQDFLKTLSPMGTISDVADIVEAVVYLTEARQVTGEVLHVDGGAHSGKW